MDKVIPIKHALQAIPDLCSKQGISHSFRGMLPLVLLGLLARQISMTHIAEWASPRESCSTRYRPLVADD